MVQTLFTGQRAREREREKEGGRERKRVRKRERESCMHVQAESLGVLFAFLIQSVSQSVSMRDYYIND